MTHENFKYETEQFDDVLIMRYKVPGFDQLTLQQKIYIYYLSEAAYFGREIVIDQNYKHNLLIKRTLEMVYQSYTGNRNSESFKNFIIYLKKIWVSNGIHHFNSTEKFIPQFTVEYFSQLLHESEINFVALQKSETILCNCKNISELEAFLIPIIFDLKIDQKRVNLDPAEDLVLSSANNFYNNVTQKEAEEFYGILYAENSDKPDEFGINSQLTKVDGKLVEKVWKVGGMYGKSLENVVENLNIAKEYAENDAQKEVLSILIRFYQTGDVKEFTRYNIKWVQQNEGDIDTINGFIESYGDPLGYKSTWEALVAFNDFEATKRFGIISKQAAWFEKNSPIHDEYKRKDAQGMSYRVITVAAEAGDMSPTTAIGVNLPNSEWIRAEHGSKSISLGNIEDAYHEVQKNSGMLDEFNTPEQAERIRKYGLLESKLHTGMHEVIGHGSGVIAKGVASAKETLKNYSSVIEEVRADLVALYFIPDDYMQKIGLTDGPEVGKTAYDSYITNGLYKQLVRIKPGDNIEQTHMRNRQLISKWALDNGRNDNVISKEIIDNKTFYVINDYEKLRKLFGQLLREIQRIKSEGDYSAARQLVEDYGIKIDRELHTEVVERFKKLNIASFRAFINPVLKPIKNNNTITDVVVEYPNDFAQQMMYYAQKYAVL